MGTVAQGNASQAVALFETADKEVDSGPDDPGLDFNPHIVIQKY